MDENEHQIQRSIQPSRCFPQNIANVPLGWSNRRPQYAARNSQRHRNDDEKSHGPESTMKELQYNCFCTDLCRRE
jgi:hypothetical protein